jgi:hypothetical protein
MVRKIRGVWRKMLAQTRHPREPRIGADGTSYHFSGFFPNRLIMSGTIWSPDPNTKTWHFVRLAETLAGYAEGRETLDAMRSAVIDCEL